MSTAIEIGLLLLACGMYVSFIRIANAVETLAMIARAREDRDLINLPDPTSPPSLRTVK